jgi:hypothetical protein
MNSKRILPIQLVAIGALSILCACRAPLLFSAISSEGETGKVVFIVADYFGHPVSGVSLHLFNQDSPGQRSTVTNELGICSVGLVFPGKWVVKTESPNFQNQRIEIEIKSKTISSHCIVLKPHQAIADPVSR